MRDIAELYAMRQELPDEGAWQGLREVRSRLSSQAYREPWYNEVTRAMAWCRGIREMLV